MDWRGDLVPLIIDAVVGPMDPTPPAADRARPRVIWVGPNGDRIVCTDRDGDVVLGMQRAGEDLPPVAVIEDDVVDGDGTTVRGIHAAPRTYTLPIIVTRSTWAAWRDIQQRVARALWPVDPTTGRARPGTLIVEQPDGRQRWCDQAWYLSGAEGDDINNHPVYYRDWTLLIRCTDPWTRSVDQVASWGAVVTTPTFPMLPWRVGSSQILGTKRVDVTGDLGGYGVWDITGPVDGQVLLRSETTGREFRLDLTGARSLDEGDTVTVDMRRGPTRGVRGPDGSSWWGARVGVPDMWPFLPGGQDVTVTAAGAVPGQTQITCRIPTRWLTF